MRSQLVERTGVQVPQIQHLPPDVVSLAAAEDAIELADYYGVCDGNPLSESQKITLRGALGERADRTWAASRVADFGPRQGTGKSDKIAARELAGLLLFGERLIIHTAHEFPTANECFLRLVAVFENWDDLRKKVSRIRYANGEQGIELLSGQRLKYRARTGGSGRGFAKADLLVYDEAQHLGREHLAASGPSKLANPNSQTWYAGSGGLGTSVVAWALRRDALGGDAGRLAYTEATAEMVRLVGRKIESIRPDPTDRDAWYRGMPGLGRWVTEESMQAVLEDLGPELFARECLCVWDPELGRSDGGVISGPTWDLVNSPTAKPGDNIVLVPDVNMERSAAAIVAVGPGTVEVDGVEQPTRVVEVIEHRPGVGWLVDRCKELDQSWHPTWAADGRPTAPVAGIVERLRDAGLDVVEAEASDLYIACGDMLEAIVDRTVTFRRHASMDAAVEGADQRFSGEAWVWDRRGAVDISTLMGATVGLWASEQVAEADFFTI